MSWLHSFIPNPWLRTAVDLALLSMLALVAYVVARRYILRGMRKLIDESSFSWDGTLFENRVPHRLSLFIPLLVLEMGMVWIPDFSPAAVERIQRVIGAGMFGVGALTLAAFLSAGHTLYLRSSAASARTITTYVQLTKLIVYMVAAVFVVARLLDESPWYFMSGLGAVLAVVLLIFRDTILSLVASIQVTHLDLVRIGDRIEMPQLGADGQVIDIALTAVKVRNLDRTVTVIPTHKFLDQGFRNWRSVMDGGGRRIMRSIPLSTSSIRFLTPEEMEGFQREPVLAEYLRSTALSGDGSAAGRPTNLGALRATIIAYLRAHPHIRDDLPMMVRQLELTTEGVPLQIYAFASEALLEGYESTQTEIFDQILPMVREFGLEIYQRPTGRDLAHLESSSNRLAGNEAGR